MGNTSSSTGGNVNPSASGGNSALLLASHDKTGLSTGAGASTTHAGIAGLGNSISSSSPLPTGGGGVMDRLGGGMDGSSSSGVTDVTGGSSVVATAGVQQGPGLGSGIGPGVDVSTSAGASSNTGNSGIVPNTTTVPSSSSLSSRMISTSSQVRVDRTERDG